MTEITKSTEAKKDEMQVEKEKLESVKRADAAVKTMHDFTSPEVLYKELINSVLKYHPSTDISMIEKAYKVASEAHEGQKRKSGEPYIIHPLCVAIILADLELDKETIVAGLLHDAVEDTWMTYEEVEKEFGSEVALLVDGVTKLGQLSYSASDRTRRDFTRSSISPVARFLLTAPPLSSTTPVTAITNSLLSLPAFAKPSSSMLPFSKISCMIPERSLKSTKIIPPLSRAF